MFSRSAQQLPTCTSLASLAVLPVCPTAPAETCLPGAKANTWQAGFCIQPQPVFIRTLHPLPGTPADKAPLLLPQEKHKAIQAPYGRPCLFANALSVSLDYLIGPDKALFIDDDEVINLLKNYNDLSESEKDTVKNVLKALNVRTPDSCPLYKLLTYFLRKLDMS